MNNTLFHVSFPYLGIKLSINPIAFCLGPLKIHWYGVILTIGIFATLSYVYGRAREFKIDVDKLSDIVICGITFGIIGARLYYVAFYPGDFYKNNPLKVLNISEGGIAIYGALIFGLSSGAIAAAVKKQKIAPLLDLASIALLMGQSIGRWGNFVNQEAFGKTTDLPWAMTSEATSGNLVHPCFLYESLWCAIGFLVLHIYSKRLYKNNGEIFLLYLLWYGAGRLFIEELRTDSLLIPVMGIKISQAVSICLIIISLGSLVYLETRELYIRNRNT